MKPFDPRLIRAADTARRGVVSLGAIGILQGIATVLSAFAITALVMAVVRSDDSVIAPSDRPLAAGVPDVHIATAAALVIGIFAVRGLLSAATERVAARAGVEVQAQLRSRLLAAWMRRDSDRRPERAKALTLAAQGTTSIEPYVARFLPALITAAVVPALAIAALLLVDWPSALIVVLTIGLLPVFGSLIGMATRDDTQARWRALSDLAGHYLDVVRGLPTLVAYGRAQRQVGTIRQVSEGHRAATMRTLRLAFLSSAALELVATISVAIVAVTVGLRLVFGGLTLEVGLLAILLAPEAYWPVRRVGAEFHSAADGTEALAEVLAELDRDCGDHPAEPHQTVGQPALTARDVYYTYPGTECAVLAGIDVSAGAGLLAITGPSGIGKTTLLEVLAGIRRPQRGTVSANGHVHLVTQRPFLAAGTLRRNLLLGTPEHADRRIAETIAKVGLTDLISALPHGLDTQIGDDGFGLSAGQRARVVLARAILSEAPIVLLDEPTAHLDIAGARQVHALIRGLAEQRVVVVVSHRPELVALADDELVLRARSEVPSR